jgi:putative endonuclease
MKANSYQKGLWAEWLCMLWLSAKGYRILRWRYKTKMGEVDIIARRKNTIHFIEVKNRPDADKARYAVSEQAKARISRAASHFIQNYRGGQHIGYSFDFMGVSGFSISHLDNVWFCPT